MKKGLLIGHSTAYRRTLRGEGPKEGEPGVGDPNADWPKIRDRPPRRARGPKNEVRLLSPPPNVKDHALIPFFPPAARALPLAERAQPFLVGRVPRFR